MAAPQKDEKTGVYYFRKGVPLALREAVGLTELRKSLGTKDPVEAKRRHAEMAVEVDAEWARLRRIHSTRKLAPRAREMPTPLAEAVACGNIVTTAGRYVSSLVDM